MHVASDRSRRRTGAGRRRTCRRAGRSRCWDPVWLFPKPMSLPPWVVVVLNHSSSEYTVGLETTAERGHGTVDAVQRDRRVARARDRPVAAVAHTARSTGRSPRWATSRWPPGRKPHRGASRSRALSCRPPSRRRRSAWPGLPPSGRCRCSACRPGPAVRARRVDGDVVDDAVEVGAVGTPAVEVVTADPPVAGVGLGAGGAGVPAATFLPSTYSVMPVPDPGCPPRGATARR